MIELYEKIKSELLASKKVKYVDMYANQIQRLISPSKNTTGVITIPAVLIEFTNTTYNQQGSDFQNFTCTLRLHIVYYALKEVGIRSLQALEDVHEVVSRMYTNSTGVLIRTSMDTDNDYQNTIVNVVYYDFVGGAPKKVIEVATPAILEIEAELNPEIQAGYIL